MKNNMSIAYSITENTLEDLFNKALQGELFVKFREVIMGWKNIDTLHIWLPLTMERVVNMEKVEPIKEVIEFKVDTKHEHLGAKKLYIDIVIHGNKKWINVITEVSCDYPIKNENVCLNLYSSNDDVTVWSQNYSSST